MTASKYRYAVDARPLPPPLQQIRSTSTPFLRRHADGTALRAIFSPEYSSTPRTHLGTEPLGKRPALCAAHATTLANSTASPRRTIVTSKKKKKTTSNNNLPPPNTQSPHLPAKFEKLTRTGNFFEAHAAHRRLSPQMSKTHLKKRKKTRMA